MTYRDILVLVDDKSESTSLITAAVHQAQRSQAMLIGAFIKPAFIYPYMGSEFGTYVPGDVIQTMMDDHAATVLKASQKAKEQFEAHAAKAKLDYEWRELEGSNSDALIALARCTDLLVYPKTGIAEIGYSAADITLAVGGPVLLVQRSEQPTLPARALVAWNASREAANALRGAWPMLKGLEVSVVCVSDKEQSLQSLEDHIKRHDLVPSMNLVNGRDADAGEIVQEQTKTLNCNLVVMGLYGRTRLQELILGGASRRLLHADDPTLLLVAH